MLLLLAASDAIPVAIIGGTCAIFTALIGARTTVYVTRATSKAANNERAIESELTDLRAENKRLKAQLARERRKKK